MLNKYQVTYANKCICIINKSLFETTHTFTYKCPNNAVKEKQTIFIKYNQHTDS